MAFREKSAWISLFATLLIWGLYFADLTPDLGLGQVDIGRTLGSASQIVQFRRDAMA